MKCPKCQFENPDGIKFCGDCGTKLDLPCPHCNYPNPPQFKFCGECGKNLREPSEVPAIDYSQPQSYTPKFLAEKILMTRSSIEGERKLVTVLFADVANYTSISETLDPEKAHDIMDGCFSVLMDKIHKHEGTINQFTGDGVMALFGAPIAHEDHAQRACRAALIIQEDISDYSEKIKKDIGIDFSMRIGLNSGYVVVGSIGDDLRMDYTAVGDTTNLASRMEGAANPGRILISKNTYMLVKDYFEFETLSKIEMKGKKEPQEAYELLRTSEIDTRFRASVAKGLTRFVGRENSIPALMEVYDKAMGGSGQVVGIVGEAGVGKSRLLLEFRNRTIQDRYTYLEGRSLHYGGSMPYLPMLDVIRSYFEIKEGDREFIIKQKIKDKILSLDEKLKNAILPIHDLLSLKVDDEQFNKLEPQKKREKTFEAIRDLLIRMSQEKPLIVAIEDLHWIDKTTEEFLDYLIGWLTSTPILLILLYRPEYTHQWGSKSYYNRIGLDQLTTLSSAELIQAILEEGEVAPELRELILNRTAGNPLFVEEFTYSLLENGSIERKDKKYVLSGKATDIHVPDTIQGIIAARMDRLEDNLKRTMQVASVIGRDFAFRILQTITGMREELKSHLLNLQGLEFIYEKSLFPELEYIFKHAMTQEVAYDSLLAKRRKEVHERIGEAIEQIYAERLEEFYEMLAYHFDRGEVWDKALFYFRQAGAKAMTRSANSEAVTCFEQALVALQHLPEHNDTREEAIDLRFDLRNALWPLGEFGRILNYLRETEILAQALNDQRRLGRVSSYLTQYFWMTGEPERALEAGQRALVIGEAIPDFTLQVETSFRLGQAYYALGDYYRGIEFTRRNVESLQGDLVYERFGMPGLLSVTSRCVLVWCLTELGEFTEGIARGEEGLRIAEAVDTPYSIVVACFGMSFPYLYKGETQQAITMLERGLSLCDVANIPLWFPRFAAALGSAYALSGNNAKALPLLEQAVEQAASMKIMAWYSLLVVWLSEAYLLAGRMNEAIESAERAFNLSRDNKARGPQAWAHRLLGDIAMHRDPPEIEEAETSYQQALAIADELGMRPLQAHCHRGLGTLYNKMERVEQARTELSTAIKLYSTMEMTFWLPQAEAALG